MPHIPLLIISSAIFFMQPLYSMESDKKEKKRPSLSLRKKSTDNSSPKQKHTPYDSHDQDHIASVSLITSSRSTSTSPEISLSQPSKEPKHNRSKTVDTPPIQPKEHHKLSIFSHSESTDKEKTSKQKGYGRSKTVDSASSQPREPFKLKMLSVSDGATSFSSLKISPRSKLTSSAKNTPQANKISPLINAVKNYDLDTIEQYCNEQGANLNQTDQEGNTALHHAIIKLTEITSNEAMLKKFIKLFLENPHTDTSIMRHEDNRTASQILIGGQNPEMRILLFARLTLDTTTNHEIGKMLIESYIYNIILDDHLIRQTVESIKNKILSTENKQGDSDLPQEATLPNYATNDFIFTMIKHRIPKEVNNISELQKNTLKKTFFQERDNFILSKSPLKNYEESTEESIEKILNVINQHHNYLSKLITKPYIFEMLKTYVEKQNEENKPKDFFQFYSQNHNNNNNNY